MDRDYPQMTFDLSSSFSTMQHGRRKNFPKIFGWTFGYTDKIVCNMKALVPTALHFLGCVNSNGIDQRMKFPHIV